MMLCDLCHSIPFDALPETPGGGKGAAIPNGTLTDGEEMVQFVYFGDEASKILEPVGYPYYDDMSALEVSAQTCPLCALVHKGALQWWQQYEAKEETDASFREFSVTQHPKPVGQKLWLTKRLNGSPGFLVLVRNPVMTKDMASCYLLTAVGFSVDQDHVLANDASQPRVVQRPMESDSGSEGSLRVASELLQQCCEAHGGSDSVNTLLPSRILDIEAPGDLIRLVDGRKIVEKYACLSYCWGETTPFTTTNRETLESHKVGIDPSTLPKTMRDAVFLARHLGIRYLWIDGLCICQDDTDEWARESSNMLHIYSQAHLVIAANHAGDSSQGLFHNRTLQPSVFIADDYLPITSGGSHSRIHASLLRTVTEWRPDDPAGEPLPKRGWAMQERVLARRSLVYGSRHFFFECSSGCGLIGEDGSGRPANSGPWRPFPPISSSSSSCSSSSSLLPGRRTVQGKGKGGGGSEADLRKWWNRMIWDYGRRKLTRGSDMLPAMSGLAKLFRDSMAELCDGEEEEYVAGLWSGSMMEGLAWQGIGDKTPLAVPKGSYVAPSWSWAGYGGIAAMGLRKGWEDLAELRGWAARLKSKDIPFGEVERKGTWLEIRGPMARLTRGDIENEKTREHEERLRKVGMTPLPRMRTMFTDEAEDHMVSLDYDEVRESKAWKNLELYALVLGGYPKKEDEEEGNAADWQPPSDTYFALALTTSPDGDDQEGVTREAGSYGKMTRVGWCFIGEAETAAMAADEGGWSTVTIV